MEKRRRNSTFLIAVLGFILLSQSIYARLLPTYQEIKEGSSMLMAHEEDDIANLMGMEECAEEDEVCVKGRMVAEAHLDYIYTQHQNLKGSP